MEIADGVELAFIVVLLAIIMHVSVIGSYKALNNINSETELVDKNSSTDYSTDLSKYMVSGDDLEDTLISLLLCCDTDKLANMRIIFYINGEKQDVVNIANSTLSSMKYSVTESVQNIIGDSYSAITYGSRIGLNEADIEVYVTR